MEVIDRDHQFFTLFSKPRSQMPMSRHDGFHACHSPTGAWFTFTCGAPGIGGGFGLETGAIPSQDVVIGVMPAGGGRAEVLPFYLDHTTNALASFTPEQVAASGDGLLRPLAMRRDLELTTDRFLADRLTFELYTPIRHLPEPGRGSTDVEREAYLPTVAATLVLDNRDGDQDQILVLGVHWSQDGVQGGSHRLDLGDAGLGVGFRGRYGMAVAPVAGARLVSGFDRGQFLMADATWSSLAPLTGFHIPVAKGTTVRVPVVFGGFIEGTVTTGVRLHYRYADLFTGLADVLASGLRRHSAIRELAARQDAWLVGQKLGDDRSRLLAQAIRGWQYSTQALMDGADPVWVVNEGEYAMTNTFDLTVDQVFFEADRHPWTVRSVLDLMADRYRYDDGVVDPLTKQIGPGGVSFPHDMGVANVWSEPGTSSYERPGLSGCFSYMTAEQLTNWILCATTYVQATGDEAWLQRRSRLIDDCLDSLLNRDHFLPERRIGIVQCDSTRCAGGAEITTYDSLDTSLGQARNNLYLGVKTFASWLGLELLLRRLGHGDRADQARAAATRAGQTLAGRIDPATGWIPAVFEDGNQSAILPAIEGLAFPRHWGLVAELSPSGPFAGLLGALQQHLSAILRPGICLFPDGGWKLSSTSDNSWMSKIFICQQVAEQEFGLARTATEQVQGDAAHWQWQAVGSFRFGPTDQVVAGRGRGSKYYPRLVSSWLWVDSSAFPT